MFYLTIQLYTTCLCNYAVYKTRCQKIQSQRQFWNIHVKYIRIYSHQSFREYIKWEAMGSSLVEFLQLKRNGFSKPDPFSRLPEHWAYASTIKLIWFLHIYKMTFPFKNFKTFVDKDQFLLSLPTMWFSPILQPPIPNTEFCTHFW